MNLPDGFVGVVLANGKVYCEEHVPRDVDLDEETSTATTVLVSDSWKFEVGPCCECGTFIADVKPRKRR